jgi:hypothetical protein
MLHLPHRGYTKTSQKVAAMAAFLLGCIWWLG